MVPAGQRGCDPADIAQAMQHMVRSELRKIFQVRRSSSPCMNPAASMTHASRYLLYNIDAATYIIMSLRVTIADMPTIPLF